MPSKYAFIPEKLENFYRYPEQYRMKPFRILGNLFFVGNMDVGSYIINTGDGLILIDTTYPTTRALLVQSIWEAGFSPAEIKLILHTHGHFDHFGGTSLIVSLSGAKTYLGAPDAEMFRTRPEMALIADSRYSYTEPFIPGVELKEKYGNSDCRDLYLKSLEKVRNEPVDIVLGNHTGQNRTQEKYKVMCENPLKNNPFIDPHEWKKFLDFAKAMYIRMLSDEADGTDQI